MNSIPTIGFAGRVVAGMILSVLCLSAVFSLDRLDIRMPEVFAQPLPGMKSFTALCTYAVNNAAIIQDGEISFQPKSDGSSWYLRMKAGDMEITGTTPNSLLFLDSRYTMSRPDMVQKWNYDTRTSQTKRQSQGYITQGTLELDGKINSRFSTPMGSAPLDSDFLGFQLGALLAQGARDFNADFMVKNRNMKVNADFIVTKADSAKIETILGESGVFRSGLAKILKPGCLVYTIRLTGVIGAFFSANVYAAYTDEPVPSFLAYWNTNATDREGLWIRPAENKNGN